MTAVRGTLGKNYPGIISGKRSRIQYTPEKKLLVIWTK